MKTALIVPGAGSGHRLGTDGPKALVDVAGAPLLRRTLDQFAGLDDLIEVVVVAPAGAIPEVERALADLGWEHCELAVVAGADSRQSSVRCGLLALGSDAEIVCVHDAARPLVSPRTIAAVIGEARVRGAASAASRPRDSVREEVGDAGETRPIDRERLWLVETPQAFHRELLERAHEHARALAIEATDDAALVEEWARRPVALVESDTLNLKVTFPYDLEVVRAIFSTRPPSVTRR